MDNFKAARGADAGLTRYIDLGVYTKNRGIRILGSAKCTDLSRKLVKADWHAASREAQDEEFFITKIISDHTKIAEPNLGKSPKKKSISKTKEATKQRVRGAKVGSEYDGEDVVKDANCVELPQTVVDAVRTKFLNDKQAMQFELKYCGKGILFKLQRVQAGHCDICNRVHESDNAFLKLRTSGLLSFHCYRSLDAEP
ncbi:hypothetical protein BG011_002891, partial [Mortierella polycephala]